MNQERTYHSNYAIHPGSTLEDELNYLGISQVELAARSGLTKKHINEIINKKASISPETALKFEKVLGLKASFWLAYQRNYDEATARIEADSHLEKEIKLLPEFKETFKELTRIGVLPAIQWKKSSFSDIVSALLSFFGTVSLSLVQDSNLSAAYRKYNGKNINHNNIAAWLRLGQLKAQRTETLEFNEKQLKKRLEEIKALSTLDEPLKFLPRIEKILADCGVVLVCAPYLKKTYTQGATQWVKTDKAFIILKTTNQSADKFWFNLFHEIGHILKHGSSKTFIDLEDKHDSKEEQEADLFAGNLLLPEFDEALHNKKLSRAEIEKVAKKYKVSNSIIAGRLSYESKNYQYYNKFIQKLDYQNVV
ncbi:MAG: HigA family addiction module antidote protein [Cyanobacteria bacterium REEB446]|nr:HigA family addiction module antidote protein [Cyanobacteria bacterium REEB446]